MQIMALAHKRYLLENGFIKDIFYELQKAIRGGKSGTFILYKEH